MAKILIYTDPHFAVTSSILNMKSGYKYSARLDHLVESFKWMYELAKSEEVDAIICGGDLMDSDIIKPEECSALSEAMSHNPGIPEFFLLGNHEKKDDLGRFNSISLLNNNESSKVISEPSSLDIAGIKVGFLPYTRDINSIYDKIKKNESDVLISHMNFNGMTIGKSFIFEDGIDMDEILKSTKLVLNGHIHNYSEYENGKVINIGSLIGSGFGDNYSKNLPGVAVLNTEDLSISHIDNPNSVTFHVIKAESIAELMKEIKRLNKHKNSKCLRIEVPYAIRDDAREYIDSISKKNKILNTRIIGKIDNSKVVLNSKDEEIETFASSSEAVMQYLNTINESDLPSTKDKMVKFIADYLV